MAERDNFEVANQRARDLQAAIPRAISAHYDRRHGHIVVHLSSKLTVSFSPRDAQGLENAKGPQLEAIEISPSGFGLYFPKLDADIYAYWRACWDRGNGWLLGSVRLAANPEA